MKSGVEQQVYNNKNITVYYEKKKFKIVLISMKRMTDFIGKMNVSNIFDWLF